MLDITATWQDVANCYDLDHMSDEQKTQAGIVFDALNAQDKKIAITQLETNLSKLKTKQEKMR